MSTHTLEPAEPGSPLAAARPDRPRQEDPDQAQVRKIPGVRFERLAGYHDHRGTLYPFLDFERPFWSEPKEPVVHGYVFTVRPGRIKGWGLHKRQADRYFVLSGSLRVVLYDGREEAAGRSAEERTCEIFFTPESTGLVYIPPGVWHATQNWGRKLGRVANFPTVRFDPRDPDKYRVDVHSETIPFDWTLRDF